MAKHRATFTFDEETEQALRRAADRLSMSKSEVVREAVQEYSARAARLSDAERRRMLAALDGHLERAPSRSDDEVDAELAQLRQARRGGGRTSRS